jgi:hypothetical protein
MADKEENMPAEEARYTGQCLCGSVRYDSGPPVMMGRCYCVDCRRVTGSGYAPVMAVLESDLTITGEIRLFEIPSAQGLKTWRGFCPQCGSPMVGYLEKNPGIAALYPGTLDDPELFRPQVNLWLERAPSWVEIDKSIPGFDRQPVAEAPVYDTIRDAVDSALPTTVAKLMAGQRT